MLKYYLQLIRFDKPIGTLLLLWPTLWAIEVASQGRPKSITLIVFIIEVFLTRSAGCIINDYADINFDKQVKRTQNRPLTSGRITKIKALLFFSGLSLLAFILAIIFLKLATLALSIPALFILISYPYTKRFLSLPQAYLGIAFSFGIPMAFIEISGNVNLTTGLLFAANLFWVLGYDTVYALADITYDRKIGIKTSAITLGKIVIPFVGVCYVLLIILLTILGLYVTATYGYFIALLVALIILVYQIMLISLAKNPDYFKVWKLNNWVGFFICMGFIINYW